MCSSDLLAEIVAQALMFGTDHEADVGNACVRQSADDVVEKRTAHRDQSLESCIGGGLLRIIDFRRGIIAAHAGAQTAGED